MAEPMVSKPRTQQTSDQVPPLVALAPPLISLLCCLRRLLTSLV